MKIRFINSNLFFLFRWVNALDPKIDKGPWTPQQDRKLLENIDKFGKGEGEHCVTFQESSVIVAPYSFLKIAKKKWLSLRLFVAMATVYNILICMEKKSQVCC